MVLSEMEGAARDELLLRGPCPSYFRACCNEAYLGRANDGVTVGYDHPGFHLTIHLPDEQPYEAGAPEWNDAVSELAKFIRARADTKVVEWYCHWLPRCMELIPRRRRKSFLRGVYRAAVHNGWID